MGVRDILNHSAFQRLWLPGFLLQSVIIGGGYATGRELVEFFLQSGPAGGLLGMLVATVLFSIASALSFELARMSRSYNYRDFFRQLLGRGWFAYEIAYFSLGLLVLAVVGAAAGELVQEHLGLYKSAGTVLLMIAIAFLVFRGSSLIEKVLAGWSFLLYATYAVMVACYLWRFGGELIDNLVHQPVRDGWFGKGVAYFGYNAAIIPIILFCVRHMQSRQDALIAGALAGPLVMVPALLFYLAMAASFPGIVESPVPSNYLTGRLGFPWLNLVFYIVIFGTFIETGAAFIHAVNERVAASRRDKRREMPSWLRLAIAVVALLIAIVLAVRIGLIDLIGKGYGTLTWVFLAIFILPLVTLGTWKILNSKEPGETAGSQ